MNIITPEDDPIGFHLDWRHRTAMAAEKMLPGMARDPDLKAYYQHLHCRPNPAFKRIAGWHGTVTGQILEAYLVTRSTVEAIAEELGLAAVDVQRYGHLFWAVRDHDMPKKGVLARLRAALPSQPGEARLLRAALMGGLEGLRRQLGSPEQGAELSAMVEHELARRVMAGELRTGDLIRLRGHDLMMRKIELDSRDGVQQDNEATELLFDLLGKLAPTMKPVEQSQEALHAADVLLRARIDSQRMAQGGRTRDAEGERLDGFMKGV